uniref:Uncharacterized protein n=1 Tax=Tanacetum cinerariifolium TaxID=118510 RepID=A0A699I4D2_TANCI|nr:hypothetical protein [Tanacetum cinerariifolium]
MDKSTQASKLLVKLAQKNGSSNNVTILVIDLMSRILSWKSFIKVDAMELSFFPVSPAMFFRDDISCCA